MPRTKKQSVMAPQQGGVNGSLPGEVLTLADAAAYLRLPQPEVVRLVSAQGLPGRQAGDEWRFLRSALQAWLSQPAPDKEDFWESCAGAFKDDPQLQEIVKDAYRRRGRPATEED